MKKRHDKREHKRQNLHAHALVKKEGSDYVFSGEIINISNMGAYLAVNGLYSKNEQLDLTIYFQHETNQVSMTIPCKVARIDGKGVGLTSSHIDAHMLQRLELIFDVSKENTKQLIEDFCKTI